MTTPGTEELTTWVHRGVALFCLGALIPGGLMAADQVAHLAPWLLAIFGGGIGGLTLAMVIVSDRPLFGTARPVVEPQAAYLSALAAALRSARANGTRVVVRPVVVETVQRR